MTEYAKDRSQQPSRVRGQTLIIFRFVGHVAPAVTTCSLSELVEAAADKTVHRNRWGCIWPAGCGGQTPALRILEVL